MLLPMTVAIIIGLVVGAPFVVYCANYKPKTKLSPLEYNIKMKEIEACRVDQLNSSNTDADIRSVNSTWDTVTNNYKISRRIT